MSKDLAEQRKKHMRLITSVTEDKAEKRLKAKDLEMDLIKGENKVLQEQVRNLHKEAQVWRDVARSNEVAVNVLRGKLQHALAQAARGRGIDGASSPYLGNKHVAFSSEVWKPEAAASVRRCKGCGQGKAMVLLLPCSHLSVCTLCADGTRACPACGCAKTGSIYVNLS
uniref:Uncharacterized protein n=1 Tax=Avena sativa TaxID=4498 RepID=A0ACD5XST7_AVESA